MHTVNNIPRGKRPAILCSKTYLKLINQVDAKIKKETEEQFKLYCHVIAIVMAKYYKWSLNKIVELMKAVDTVYTDCHNEIETSSIELAWDEVGIDMAVETINKPWYEVEYLNGMIMENDSMDQKKYLYMLQQQLKWVPSCIIAAALVGMHRFEGWEGDNMVRFFNLIQVIRDEYDSDIDELAKVSFDLVGFTMTKVEEVME